MQPAATNCTMASSQWKPNELSATPADMIPKTFSWYLFPAPWTKLGETCLHCSKKEVPKKVYFY